MPNEALQKHTLNLREGDYEFLRDVYEPKGHFASTIIRILVSNHVDELRGREAPRQFPAIPSNL